MVLRAPQDGTIPTGPLNVGGPKTEGSGWLPGASRRHLWRELVTQGAAAPAASLTDSAGASGYPTVRVAGPVDPLAREAAPGSAPHHDVRAGAY